MPLHELIYISDAAFEMQDPDLQELLEHSRRKNARLQVTGILVYHERRFMQLLEGETSEVLALFDSICTDRRHRNVLNVWDHPIAERNFAEWSMAFAAPDRLALRDKPGYSEFLEHGLPASSDGSVGKRLLLRLRDDVLRAGPGGP
jgi:Sensors of blue-light using FAD